MKKFLYSLLIPAGISLHSSSQNVGIGTTTPDSKLHVVSNVLSSNSAAIYGSNTGSVGAGVSGVAGGVNTVGVSGTAVSGIGISGYSNSFRGVSAGTLSGTALYGNSTSGYGLEVVGKIKLSGGNTNPSAGAVLTSDAAGNAVWKTSKVGFLVSGYNPNLISMPKQTNNTVHLMNELFDYGNNYNAYAGTSPSFGHSTFVAPVSGLYHFDAMLGLRGFGGDPVLYPILTIVVQRGATIFAGAQAEFSPFVRNSYSQNFCQAIISSDIKLVSGDIVYLRVYHSSDQSALIWVGEGSPAPHWGGHLVFAE
jgi:hypothetical protein